MNIDILAKNMVLTSSFEVKSDHCIYLDDHNTRSMETCCVFHRCIYLIITLKYLAAKVFLPSVKLVQCYVD